jgi:hypothetical protein
MTSPFRGSASGWTRQQLRNSRFAHMSRDIYVLRDRDLDLRTRVDAAKLVVPNGVPCLWTAAELLKLPVDADTTVHLAGGRKAVQSVRADLTVHRLTVRTDETRELRGLLVTDGPRTFTDFGPHLDLEALVALGDVVVRRWGPVSVAVAVSRAKGRPGVALLRQALALLDPKSDSPAETRARLRLHAAGFTRMRHKVVIRDAGGGWLGVADLADEEAKVALQHEGASHFAKGERQRRKDIDRDELARAEDWQVVGSTALDDAQPDRLIDKVTAAYRRAARLSGPHVLPPHLL